MLHFPKLTVAYTVDEDDVWISAPALFGVEVDQLCQVVRVATSDEEVRDLNVSFWAAKVPFLLVEGFRGCPVCHPTPELVSVVFVEQLVPLVRVSFPIVLVGVPDLPIVTERGQLVVVLGVQQIHKVFVHASHDRVANLESGNIWSFLLKCKFVFGIKSMDLSIFKKKNQTIKNAFNVFNKF